MKHIIDTNILPKPYLSLEIVTHKGMGDITWNPKKSELYLDAEQTGDGYIKGEFLRDRLDNKQVVNATFMDYLYENNLFPDSWKTNAQGKTNYIYAWGTIYRDSSGRLCVRCWCWSDGTWQRGYSWLDCAWGGQNPALVLASPQSVSTGHSKPLALETRIGRLERFYEKVIELIPSLEDIDEQ